MSLGRNSQPPDGSSQPTDSHPENALIRAMQSEVRVLETHREVMTAAIAKLGADTQDARDRVLKLETKFDSLIEKVNALPSKAWIGTVVVSAMGFFGSIIAIVSAVVHFWR